MTGASAGIGRELAVQLARRCGTLVLLARWAELLDKLRDDLAARHPRLVVAALPADLSDEGIAVNAVAPAGHSLSLTLFRRRPRTS